MRFSITKFLIPNNSPRHPAPAFEPLEARTLLSVEPILVLPGLAGSMPDLGNVFSAASNLSGYLTGSGVSPTSLVAETNDNAYSSLLNYLGGKPGYVLNRSVIFAAYDWRLPIAPSDGVNDGQITLPSSMMNSTSYQYGVQYLKYWIDQAKQYYIDANGSAAGFRINIIAHSMGGLVLRAFVQSDYYQQNYAGVIDRVVTLGVPETGDAAAYITTGQSVGQFLGALPGGNSLLQGVLNLLPISGSSIASFAPGINDLLPTYSGASSNGTPPVNPILPDLNANLSTFTSRVGPIMAESCTGTPTISSVNLGNDSFSTSNNGDGVVLATSAYISGLGAQASYTGVAHNLLPASAQIQQDAFTFLTAGTAASPLDSGTTAYLTSVYQDLLGRTPDSAGLAAFTNLLQNGATRASVAQTIETSAEYTNTLVSGFYTALLNRPADSGGLSAFSSAIQSGTPIEQVQAILIGSAEYFATRGQNTNTGFLTALYADTLGRAPDAGGLATFTAQLAGGTTRQQVAAEVLGSAEYKGVLARSLFDQFLGRDPGSSESAAAVAALQAGTTDQTEIASLIGSDEYFGDALKTNGTADQKFIVQAYRDMLGRNPDQPGFTTWDVSLNAGTLTRLQVAEGLENTDEYRTLVAEGFFQQFLGRAPDTGGLATFVGALRGGASDESVIATILGSAEYFQNHGGTNAAFLAALYQYLLGRPVDPTGSATFLPLLNSGTSRATLASMLLSSAEYRDRLVDALYEKYLGRPADTTGLSAFVATLSTGGTDESIAAALVASDEYLART